MTRMAKRTYLISYVITSPYGVGRCFNDRSTNTGPSRSDIENIEAKLTAEHGCKVVITAVSQIEPGEMKP